MSASPNVVADVLPYYLRFYTDVEPDRYCKISHTEDADTVVSTIDKCKASYKKYKDLYDDLMAGIRAWRCRNGQNPEIGYREVDQLIWYYFKGANRRRKKEALRVVHEKEGLPPSEVKFV